MLYCRGKQTEYGILEMDWRQVISNLGYEGRCGRWIYHPWEEDRSASPPEGAFNYDERAEAFVQAAEDGNWDFVTACLDDDLSPNTHFELETALHKAAKFGHAQVVRLLLTRGAYPSPEASNGLTPLHLASCYNQVECVQLLIASGADVNAHGHGYFGPGFPPAYFAAQRGSLEALEMLLHAGADPHGGPDLAGNIRPCLLTSTAAYYGDLEMLELLVKYGADINLPSEPHGTLLDMLSQDVYEPSERMRENKRKVKSWLITHDARRN
jgi:ankyrin repeat protein